MAYGTLKCDNIVFTNGGVDQTVTVSGIVQSISGNITATGTIQGATIIGTSTVSGATVTGNVGVFTAITGGTAGFTTVTGATVTGTTASFVTVSGTTVTGTTADFGGVITAPTIRGTTTVSGATVTGTAGQFTTVTGGSAGFTTVTGATVTGTTANFATLSGTTITGGHVTTASGTYTGNVTAAAFVPTGSSVPTNGVYLPSANNVAISTNGTGRLFVDASGNVGVGTQTPSTRLSVNSTTSATSASFSNSTSTAELQINASTLFISNYDASGPIVFRPGGGTERMRLTSDGRLGLGTSSPGATFDVRGQAHVRAGAKASSSQHLLIGSTDASNAIELAFNNVTNSGWSLQSVEQGVAFRSLNLNPSGGNVGIGTTAPKEELSVIGDINVGNLAGTYGLDNSGTYEGLQVISSTKKPSVTLYSTQGSDGDAGEVRFVGWNVAGNVNSQAYIRNIQSSSSSVNPAGSLAFGTASVNSNAVERARIDSSGRLLVGTSSGFSAGGDAQYGRFHMVGNTSTSTGHAILALGRGEAATAITADEALGYITFSDNAGNTFASIHSSADAAAGSNDYPGRLVFSTTADGASSPTERMRINSGGYTTLVAVTGVQVNSSVASAGKTHMLLEGKHSGTAGVQSSGSTCFQLFTDGDVRNTNNSYGAISDAKLKENIVDANSQWDDLKALQVRNYNFKEGQTHTQIGLVAQEVELVSPGLVSDSPDRDEEGNDLGTVTKSVNYSVLYMKAVKALQEAMERIEQLESEMAEVKAQLQIS